MAAITPIGYHENSSPVTLLLQSCLVDVHACGLMQDVKVWVKHMTQSWKNAVRFTSNPKRDSLYTDALEPHGKKKCIFKPFFQNEGPHIHVKKTTTTFLIADLSHILKTQNHTSFWIRDFTAFWSVTPTWVQGRRWASMNWMMNKLK